MMKTLYKIDKYVSNDGKNWYKSEFGHRIYYGEPFDERVAETDYEELKEIYSFNFHKKSLFNRKEYVEYSNWLMRIYLKFNEGDKMYTKEKCVLDIDAYFSELETHMTPNDFINYIKDKGLNICPIKG